MQTKQSPSLTKASATPRWVLPEEIQQSVNQRGWMLRPWTVLFLPLAVGAVLGWQAAAVSVPASFLLFLVLGAFEGRRRAASATKA